VNGVMRPRTFERYLLHRTGHPLSEDESRTQSHENYVDVAENHDMSRKFISWMSYTALEQISASRQSKNFGIETKESYGRFEATHGWKYRKTQRELRLEIVFFARCIKNLTGLCRCLIAVCAI
jgi:hypothetical protein